MAESIVSDAVNKFVRQLSVEKFGPYFGGKVKLQHLEQTMKMIQARLVDAERRSEDENEAVVQLWLNRLKRVLYRLEDLVEELEMETMIEHRRKGMLPKLRSLASMAKDITSKRKVSKEFKDICKELEEIASVMDLLKFSVSESEDPVGVVNKGVKLKTHPDSPVKWIDEDVIIGRDEDKSKILSLVLESSGVVEERVSVIPIVGLGGLGKTTLAQLVYNDIDVLRHFELRSWVCISDIDSIKELVGKVFESLFGENYQPFSLEILQNRVRKAVNDKKFLLVLDDVWDEDHKRWIHLKSLLCAGKQGSKVIVTTRSKVVAQIMGTVKPYELGGLAEDESWELFRRLAFGKGHDGKTIQSLMSTGHQIFKRCAGIPLAIKTVACRLYSTDGDREKEWRSLEHKFQMLEEVHENGILLTLKLSYDHLPSHLKQCFAYCSLFPKDYEFEEQNLIYLWMAQGFIRPVDGSQSLEDLGHMYFMDLLRRSFFQDGRRHEIRDVKVYKMHDLMSDLAQRVARDECIIVDDRLPWMIISGNTLHVSFIVKSSWEVPSWLLAAKQLRSLISIESKILWPISNETIAEFFSSLKCLRALDLGSIDCNNLPDSIDKLHHLRYLRLAGSFKTLPDGITRLHNLQTLDLQACRQLTELPQQFSKLINLRHLHNEGAHNSWIHMPPRFELLTSLRALDTFIVGENNRIGTLEKLTGLAGKLTIFFKESCGNAESEGPDQIFKHTKLTDLELTWSSSSGESYADVEEKEDEWALKSLQLPQSLTSLKVHSWRGVSFPPWEIINIVSISIMDCSRCQHLPAFSRLHYLRFLRLCNLRALEYIEIVSCSSEASSSSVALNFPSLEHLELKQLPRLKGWSRVEEDDIDLQRPEDHQHLQLQLIFHRLSELHIFDCPRLMSFPLVAPQLESLYSCEVHEKLLINLLANAKDSLPTTTSSPCLSTPSMLRMLHIDLVHELDSLSINMSSLEELRISRCNELVNFTVEPPSSLRLLTLKACHRLKGISSALHHLSILENLKIDDCAELDLWEDNMDNDDDNDKDNDNDASVSAWQGLKSLHRLKLNNMSKLESLPRGLGDLTMLQQLHISDHSDLKELPDWIGHCPQLLEIKIVNCPKLMELPKSLFYNNTIKQLSILDCPELQRRYCRDGKDWPLIQAIPHIVLGS